MDLPSAEFVYLFRHASLRDAAYQLHMPSERARLHELALECIEATLPETSLDAMALELADHARDAQTGVTRLNDTLARRELAWLQRAVAFAEREYQNESAADLHARIAHHPSAQPAAQVDALISCGMLRWFVGRREAALETLTRAVRLAAGDRARRATALIERGVLYRDVRESFAAEADLREALRLAQTVGNERLQLRALGNLATVLDRGLSTADVVQMYQPVLALAERLGVKAAIGVSYGQIGAACMANHEHDGAVEWLEKSLTILRETDDRLNQAAMLTTLAHALMRRERDARGDLARATDLYRQSLAVNAEIGNTPQCCSALVGLSSCYRRLGMLEEARRYARDAIQLASEVGNPESLAGAWRELGRVQEELGDEVEAERSFSYGVFAVQDAPEYRSLADLLLALATLLARRGAFADATQHAENALALAVENYDGALADEIRAAMDGFRGEIPLPKSGGTIIRRKI